MTNLPKVSFFSHPTRAQFFAFKRPSIFSLTKNSRIGSKMTAAVVPSSASNSGSTIRGCDEIQSLSFRFWTRSE